MEKRGDLEATVECQFLKDIVDVALDRVRREVQPSGDLFVAQAFGDEDDGFAFAFRHADTFAQVTLSLPNCVIDNMTEKRSCQQGRKDFHSLCRRPNGFKNLRECRVFEDKAHSTGFNELDDVQLSRN